MDMSAFVATLTSTLAIGLTFALLRLVRQERQRSEARVAVLVTLAAETPARVPAGAVDHPPVKLTPRPAPRAARPDPAAARRTHAPVRLSAADVEIFRDAAVTPAAAAAAPDLFEPAVPRGRGGLAYVGAGALVMVAIIALGFRWAVSGSAQPTSETIASIAAPAAAVAGPLSLVSLRHEQGTDGTLVISGVVKNPSDSIARERLFAAASLLDKDGALVATARAPLDFTLLAPGEESPFVVRVTGAAGVARYRVGFRDDGGAAIPHLDRR